MRERSNYFPQEVIDQVADASDILSVISNYVHLERRGNTYMGLCPFHNEKTASFSVTPSKQMFYCFGCGVGGNVFTFLMKYENLSFPEAVRQLADRAGISLPERELSPEEKRRISRRDSLREINKEAATYFYHKLRSDSGKTAMEYFSNRQLSPETMQKFGLGYADKYSDDLYRYLKSKGYKDDLLRDSGVISFDKGSGRDRFWNRAMFPIMDINGKVIAFGGRVLGDGKPKYVNSPETEIFDKSRNMYGLYLARKSRRHGIILCEGYMDVIALHQAGFDNAAASLGTAFTDGHANLLKRFTSEVYISYDSDGAGVKAALRAIPILRRYGIAAKVVNMTPYKDPDEFIKALGAEEYEQRLQNAENGFLFTVRKTQERFNRSDPDENAAFIKEVAALLLTVPAGIDRNSYMDSAAREFTIRREELESGLIAAEQKASREKGRDRGTYPDTVREGQETAPFPEAGASPGGYNRKSRADEGMRVSQRLLLTRISEDPALYERISRWITPEDFEEGMLSTVAEEMFREIKEQGSVNPAQMISLFSDVEDQTEVGKILNAQVRGAEDPKEQRKILKESLIRVKQASMERAMKGHVPDPLNAVKTARAQIEEIKKEFPDV